MYLHDFWFVGPKKGDCWKGLDPFRRPCNRAEFDDLLDRCRNSCMLFGFWTNYMGLDQFTLYYNGTPSLDFEGKEMNFDYSQRLYIQPQFPFFWPEGFTHYDEVLDEILQDEVPDFTLWDQTRLSTKNAYDWGFQNQLALYENQLFYAEQYKDLYTGSAENVNARIELSRKWERQLDELLVLPDRPFPHTNEKNK